MLEVEINNSRSARSKKKNRWMKGKKLPNEFSIDQETKQKSKDR